MAWAYDMSNSRLPEHEPHCWNNLGTRIKPLSFWGYCNTWNLSYKLQARGKCAWSKDVSSFLCCVFFTVAWWFFVFLFWVFICFFFKFFFFFVCLGICTFACKRMLNPLQLELQMVVRNIHYGSWEPDSVLLQEQQFSVIVSLLLACLYSFCFVFNLLLILKANQFQHDHSILFAK